MKRIIEQTRKELTQTFRDRLTLAQMWLTGTAISLSVMTCGSLFRTWTRRRSRAVTPKSCAGR